MAITLETVTHALDQGGFQYLAMDEAAVFLGIQGDNLEARVILFVDEGGEYLDMRAVEYAACPAGHADLDAVLLKLAELNYRFRGAKFGWNPETGEIKAEASLPLEDNTELGHEQLTLFLGLFFSVCDEAYPELVEVLGSEPGAQLEPPTPIPGPAASPGLPPRVAGWIKLQNVMALLLLGVAAVAGLVYLLLG